MNDVCTQDHSNARGVNAPVTGSLRVRQPYGDKDGIREIGSSVGVNDNLTRNFGTGSGNEGTEEKQGAFGERNPVRIAKSEQSSQSQAP